MSAGANSTAGSTGDRPAFPSGMQVIERGWVSSNNIVFFDTEADGGNAVVDTGYVHHAAQTVQLLRHALAQHQASGSRLSRIINTHTHSDHIGGNAALKSAWPEAEITIPAGDAGIVRRWDQAALHLSTMGQECARFEFDAVFAPGATLTLGGRAWRAIASPGHHDASQMLYCGEEQILISADALWENGFGVIFPEIDGDGATHGEAFAAQRATLDAIAGLKVTRVIPGHGAPFGDCAAALERAYGRLDYFTAHPERHARNGLKVTLAFLLMIEQRIALDSLPARLAALPLAAHINHAYYQLDAGALAEFVVTELEKSRVARRAEGCLLLA